MVADNPVADIEVMDVLFANMVAAEPDVVVPVANLPFEFGAALVAAMPDGAAVDPVGAQGNDVANGAVLEAFDGLDVTRLVAALGAGGYLEVLGFGLFRRSTHDAVAGAVHRHRFFHEHILAGSDGGLEMGGAEAGRRGEDDVVHAGNRQGFFVGVKSAEAHVCRHAEVLHALPGGFREYVGHRHNLGINPHLFCRIKEVLARPPPRPPRPMITALMGCVLWPRRTEGKLAAAAAEAARSEECLRNWRRDTAFD